MACAGNSLFSKAIRLFTKSSLEINGKNAKITHVGTFYWIESELFVIEADRGQVRLSRFSEAYKKYEGRIFVNRPHLPCLKDFIARQLKLVDKKYDWKSIIGIASKSKWKLNDKWYCSELINYARMWYYTGMKPKHIKPQELIEKELNLVWEIGVI